MGDVIVDSVLVVDDEKDIADMIEICLAKGFIKNCPKKCLNL